MGAKLARIVGVAVAIAAIAAAGARLLRGIGAPGDRMSRIPHTILWAWERREDLRFIDPDRIGVAYLAATLTLSGERVEIHPRMQPLVIPPRTIVFPVVRIETDWRLHPTLSPAQRAEVASAIIRLAGASPPAIQIDFDAARSEREFYRSLLTELRKRVPACIPLSMTALPSWCIGDVWISGLPVDEAVPMLFRMGAGSSEVREYVRAGGEFVPAISRLSVGVASDEPIPGLAPLGRVYLFSPHAWTMEEAERALAEVGR